MRPTSDRVTSLLPLNSKAAAPVFHRHNYTLSVRFIIDSNNTDGLGYETKTILYCTRTKKINRGEAEKSKVIKRFKKRACSTERHRVVRREGDLISMVIDSERPTIFGSNPTPT